MTTVLSPVTLALYLHPYWFMWFGVPTPDASLYPNRAALVTYGPAFGLGWAVHRQASTVLARYADAVGPVESIRTRRTTMRVSGMAPFEISVPVEAMRPNQLRKEVTIQGNVQITAYDGTDAWRIDSFVPGGKRPTNVPAPELPDLMDVAGKRVAVHSLAVTQRDGRESVIYLDASSFLEVQRVQTRPAMGRGIRTTITPSDYRRIRGVAVPHLIEIRPEGLPTPIRAVIDRAEFDVPLQAKRFSWSGGI